MIGLVMPIEALSNEIILWVEALGVLVFNLGLCRGCWCLFLLFWLSISSVDDLDLSLIWRYPFFNFLRCFSWAKLISIFADSRMSIWSYFERLRLSRKFGSFRSSWSIRWTSAMELGVISSLILQGVSLKEGSSSLNNPGPSYNYFSSLASI